MKTFMILSLWILSSAVNAGVVSGGSGSTSQTVEGGSIGGSTGSSGKEVEGHTETNVEVIDLTSAELLEAMNQGLNGQPFVIRRPEGLIQLKPEKFDFTKKTIEFQNELGEKMVGRQLIQK